MYKQLYTCLLTHICESFSTINNVGKKTGRENHTLLRNNIVSSFSKKCTVMAVYKKLLDFQIYWNFSPLVFCVTVFWKKVPLYFHSVQLEDFFCCLLHFLLHGQHLTHKQSFPLYELSWYFFWGGFLGKMEKAQKHSNSSSVDCG